MLPQDSNFTSLGVIKAPDARPERLAFEGPSCRPRRSATGPQSAFPDALNPALFANVWYGPPRQQMEARERLLPRRLRASPSSSRATASRCELPSAHPTVQLDRTLAAGEVDAVTDAEGNSHRLAVALA